MKKNITNRTYFVELFPVQNDEFAQKKGFLKTHKNQLTPNKRDLMFLGSSMLLIFSKLMFSRK